MSDGAGQKDELDPPNAKKLKITQEDKDNVVSDELKLKDFVPDEIVNNNTNRKTVCIKGSFKGKSGVALVFFEKNAFKEEDLDDKGYFSVDTEFRRFFQNDIYGNYECYPKASINGVKSTIIYPATEKHIEKFALQENYIILETPELYENYTLPQILKAECNLKWVYNILEGKSEQDRIIHNNLDEKEGFVLLPDLKWDGVTKETLYLLAIVRERNIKSLRDLDGSHLPLLKRVRDEGKKAIFQKYGVAGNQLRVYLHYQPSFYHLHIHFTSLKHEAAGIYAERAHLLDTVINNIEMMNDYYKKASIPFTIREMDMFFEVYETNGYVQKIKSDNIELIDKTRLRSCNVYITTGVDLSKDCNLKISIQSNCIVLNYYNDIDDQLKRRDSLSSIESLSDCYSEEDSDVTSIIPIDEYCYIIPNSMSCLKINKNTISFRILTEPKNGGNFYTEFLSTGTKSKDEKSNALRVNLKSHEHIKIACANCSNVISDNFVKFDRILELPTSNLDMSEWFCHGHTHSSTQTEALTPNKQDFLYRLTFFVINNSVLSEKSNKFNGKRDIYHCNRCLAWLGMKKKETVRLFNSEIKILKDGNYEHIFTHKKTIDEINVDDFIYTIECMTKEFNLGMQYTVMCKIVLECTLSNTNKQYLLIWIMDKELQVLRNNDECIQDEDRIQLQSSFLTKILFKIASSFNEEVETWLADPAVVSTDISKGMFLKGTEHLQNMSLKVPESFRNTNGFCVSYLKV